MKIISRGIALGFFELSLAGSALAAPAETVLHAFANTDGADPYAGLIADSKGNLYGTTLYGGGSSDYGVVFELSPPASAGGFWTETVLYTFKGGNDGGYPGASLLADSKGNLYGTAESGGTAGYGVVFELSPPAAAGGIWTETVLHSFSGGADGASPQSTLIADSKGNLYGTTAEGGLIAGYSGNGVVFELSPPAAAGGVWIETALHSFTGGADGGQPDAGVIADSKGNLYGTTYYGGTSNGYGTVFELSPPTVAGGAWSETVLHAFTGGSGGYHTNASVIADSKGNLYGTVYYGGVSSFGYGIVFELSPPASASGIWTYAELHAFTGGTDGGFPYSSLIIDSKGNLFGTANGYGGASDVGTVFELSPPAASGGIWPLTVLHAFTGGNDGAGPFSNLLADNKGNLFGTTIQGGAATGNGTVYEVTGSGFVSTVPFASFTSDLAIQYGKKPNTDAFELLSEFTLASSSTGINPLTDPLTLTVGTFTTTIPSGSFKGPIFGAYYYTGVINGAEFELGIAPVAAKQFAFAAAGQNASLTGTTSPVAVTLTIGSNTGTDLINPPKGGW